jgi:hypothetical protein
LWWRDCLFSKWNCSSWSAQSHAGRHRKRCPRWSTQRHSHIIALSAMTVGTSRDQLASLQVLINENVKRVQIEHGPRR